MIAEIIPKVMEMTQRKKEKYRPRCSNLGVEQCIRMQVYSALGYTPKPIPGRGIEVMDDSTWHEELTVDRLQKTIYKVHSRQMPLNAFSFQNILLANSYKCEICKKEIPKHTVHGHIDGILQDSEGDEFLFEHKAINHFSFIAYETGNLYPVDYITQCVSYLLGLKESLDKLLKAIMVVKNKNTSKYMEYHISYDEQTDIARVIIYRLDYTKNNEGILNEVKEVFLEDIMGKAKQRIIDIGNYFIKKTLPLRQYEIDDYHCGYCPYFYECYKNYEAEIDNRKNEIKIIDENIIKIIEKHVIIDAEIKSKEKELKEYKKAIKLYMAEKNAKTGVMDGIIVRISKGSKSIVDKALIPIQILQAAIKKSVYEKLHVSKIGEEEKDGE